jgi:hypothetical protein
MFLLNALSFCTLLNAIGTQYYFGPALVARVEMFSPLGSLALALGWFSFRILDRRAIHAMTRRVSSSRR